MVYGINVSPLALQPTASNTILPLLEQFQTYCILLAITSLHAGQVDDHGPSRPTKQKALWAQTTSKGFTSPERLQQDFSYPNPASITPASSQVIESDLPLLADETLRLLQVVTK
jgi:hypothetical protein